VGDPVFESPHYEDFVLFYRTPQTEPEAHPSFYLYSVGDEVFSRG